jgi:hypothetical protein
MIYRIFISITFLSFFAIACSTGSDTQMYDVNISTSPTEAGTVTPSDTTIEKGTRLNLQAEANSEFLFSHWSGDIDSTSSNPLSIMADQDYSLIANFEKKSYQLTVNTTGDGTVSEEIVQQKFTDYDHGTVVELRAIPGTAYEFVEWTGDLVSTDNPKTIVIDEPKTVTAHFSVKNDKAAFKVNVDWEAIGQSPQKRSTKNLSFNTSITHFGARLVYPNQNAAFAQSVEKVTADSLGVITMEVPPADSARLLVAAVQYDGNDNKLLKMGVLEDLIIQSGESYEWTVNDITWSDPLWIPADSLAADYESGSFTVDKNNEQFEFYFLVKDPFYPFANPSQDNYLIRLNGTGGNSGYENGYRIMRQVVENSTVGTANSEQYDNFYPYLVSELFQLPTEGSRYVVYEKGSFTVNWE